MRNVALWLHIIGVSMWLGTNVAQMLIGRRLVNEGAGLQWLKAVEKSSGPIYGTASGLILLTGIYLVLSSNDAYSFGSMFVGIGIAVVIIGGTLAGLVFTKKTRQAIGFFESGESVKAMPVYKSIGSWAVLDTALIVFAILAMVAKWGG